MLRRYDWLLAGLVFAVFACMALHIAQTMPVFHPVDELEHFDYAVKLANGKAARVSDALEPNVFALRQRLAAGASQAYMNAPAPALEPATSFQAYHPSAFYRLAALAPGVRAGEQRGVMLLRMLCVAMVVLARILTWLALRRVNPAIALAGLAYLGWMVPVDALRFSNDAPAMLLGALTFWLFVRHATAPDDARRGWRLAGIALALLAGCAVKMTGVLFLTPALALGFACCRMPWRRAAAEGFLVLIPALIFAGCFIAANVKRDGTLTGTAHLSGERFPKPLGLSWERVLPSGAGWSFEHFLLLKAETKVAGVAVEKLSSVYHAATFAELGWVLAWGFACFGFAGAKARSLDLGTKTVSFLRGIIVAGTLTMLYLNLATALLHFGLGRVNWSARQFSMVEAPLVLVLAAGWTWALAGEQTGWKLGRGVAWIVTAASFGSLTWPYLKF